MPQTQPTQIPDAYEPGDISTRVQEERFRIRSWMGAFVACVAIASLLMVIGLVAYLAIEDRPISYIEGVLAPLQPFLLPTIGAVVGYALGSREQQ